jgi:hypothetical protein
MEGGVDQFVGDVGTVILGRVDLVDAELDGPAQHREGHGPIARGSEHPRTRQLHGAVADSGNRSSGQNRTAAWSPVRAHGSAPVVHLRSADAKYLLMSVA